MIYLSKGRGAGADSDHTWIRPCIYCNWASNIGSINIFCTTQLGGGGRGSQSHSSTFFTFPQISIIFFIFLHSFLIFVFILALQVGKLSTREGPGYTGDPVVTVMLPGISGVSNSGDIVKCVQL